MPVAQKKQSKSALPKQLLANACELSGGTMTTVVHGFAMDAGKLEGEYYIAPTLRLSDKASVRICLTPLMARQFALSVLDRIPTRKDGSPDRRADRAAQKAAPKYVKVTDDIVAAAFEALEGDLSLGGAVCARRLGVSLTSLARHMKLADRSRYFALNLRRRPHPPKGGAR